VPTTTGDKKLSLLSSSDEIEMLQRPSALHAAAKQADGALRFSQAYVQSALHAAAKQADGALKFSQAYVQKRKG